MELPHTAGCLVCGRQNPHGLKLSLHVNEETGVVRVAFTPRPEDIGFEGIVHGGVLATVLDEAMVWAATWAGKRFCVAAEMSVRFRHVAAPGTPLVAEARVEPPGPRRTGTPRLFRTTGVILNPGGERIVEATGKYMPVSPERHRDVVATLVDDPDAARAAAHLREGTTS